MKISDFVYFPRLGGYKHTKFQCAYGVEGKENKNGRYIKYHQCQMKPKYTLGEHKFCKAHLDIIEKKLKEARDQNLKDLGF